MSIFKNEDFNITDTHGDTVSLGGIASAKYFESVSVTILGTISTVMLSKYSQEAMAASSVANAIYGFIMIFIYVFRQGGLVLFNVEAGSAHKKKTGEVLFVSLVLTAVSSLIIGALVYFFASEAVTLMKAKEEFFGLSVQYLKIISLTLPITALCTCFTTFLICSGYAKFVFISSLFTNLFHVALSYVILYRPFEIPLYGFEGLGHSVNITRCLSLIISIALYIYKKCPFRLKFTFNTAKRILNIGIPMSISSISYNFSQTFTTEILASLSTEAVNAKTYISTIFSYVQIAGYAISQASAVLAGRYRGMRDYTRCDRVWKHSVKLAVACNLCLSVFVYILKKPLLSVFTDSPETIRLACVIMAIDIAVEVLRAVNNVCDQSLCAVGDIRFQAFICILSCWTFSVLFSWIFAIKLGLGLIGCWIAFTLDESARAVCNILRWKSKKWTDIGI